MTLTALAGKFGLLQAGILAVVIAGTGFGLASSNLIGNLGDRQVAQQLEQSVFRTKGQSADAQEATSEIGATLVEMSGGSPAQEAIPRSAAYPPPATADEPAPPENRDFADRRAAFRTPGNRRRTGAAGKQATFRRRPHMGQLRITRRKYAGESRRRRHGHQAVHQRPAGRIQRLRGRSDRQRIDPRQPPEL